MTLVADCIELFRQGAALVAPLAAALGGFIQEAGAAAGDAAAAGAGTVATFAAAAQPEAVARRLRFLAWGYTAVWLVLAAYLVLLSLRQRRLETQLRRLRERVVPPTRI